MSLRRLFLSAFTALVLGILGLGIISILMIRNENRMNQAQELRYRSYLLADELRQSSDDLTRMARLFVVTRDPRYEATYGEILDIRNGKTARPIDYHRIYWDLVLDRDQRPRGTSATVPLQDLMRLAGFTETEFDLIRQAQANSDGLVRTETVAMNAVKGLDPEGRPLTSPVAAEVPVQLMHDAAYMQAKARIMAPIDEFLGRVEDRTRRDVEALEAHGHWLLLLNRVLAGLMLALTVGFGVLVPRTIFRQLGGEPRLVEQAVRRLAEGDLQSRPSTLAGVDASQACGIVAAMDGMTDRLRGVVSEVGLAARHITRQSQTVSGSATDLSQAAGEQAQATHEASAAMHQIIGSIKSTAEHVSQTGILAQKAALDARSSGTAVADTVGSMRAIAERVLVIGEFARKTRILSLNAAIEAARARVGGKGFSVVASEVRALAERSEEAAGEIDRLVAASLQVAEKARALIERLVPAIEETSNLVEQIRDTSRQQSAGAQQIGIALHQIETVAQRDSVASAQLLELSHALASQARRLDDAMAFFRLGDHGLPSHPSAEPSRVPLRLPRPPHPRLGSGPSGRRSS